MKDTWLIVALVLAAAGGLVGAMSKAWALVCVAVAVAILVAVQLF